jgi:GAF domain-containing protein
MSNPSTTFDDILVTVREIVEASPGNNDTLQRIVTLLRESVAHYDWVGFYILDEGKENLILAPFDGEPTIHETIPVGKGICGQAAASETTLVIQDVTEETNYLSCSIRVRAEIVIPIFKNDELVGELDIDSHTSRPFTEHDRTFLEKVCEIVSPFF